jgi:hypothetical protein
MRARVRASYDVLEALRLLLQRDSQQIPSRRAARRRGQGVTIKTDIFKVTSRRYPRMSAMIAARMQSSRTMEHLKTAVRLVQSCAFADEESAAISERRWPMRKLVPRT